MMQKHVIYLALLGALALGYPHAVSADAYGDLVGIAGQPGNVPEPSAPQPVDSSSEYDNSDSSDSGGGSENTGTGVPFQGLFNLFKPKPVDPVQKSAEIGARGDRAYKGENYQAAVRYYKRALKHTPGDASLQRRLADAERALRLHRADRAYEQRQREKKRMAARKKTLQSPVPPLPAPTPIARPKPVPVVTAQPAAFVSAAQTRSALRDIKARIDALKKAGSAQNLNTLLAKYASTWALAITRDDLSDKDREGLQLDIPVRDVDEAGGKPATIARDETPDAPQEPDYGENKDLELMLSRFNAERAGQGAEQLGENFTENVLPESIAGKFANVLALGKVSVELSQGNVPGAAKELADVIIGKLAIPQASFAVEGGRIYSSTAFIALNKFMEDSTRAVGGSFDRKEFWESLRNQMTTGQKGVMEWIGGPDAK